MMHRSISAYAVYNGLAEFAARRRRINFSGGVYVGENTAQSASVRIARLRRAIVRAADCNPLPENRMIFRQAKK